VSKPAKIVSKPANELFSACFEYQIFESVNNK
jgi:hypothetical protein